VARSRAGDTLRAVLEMAIGLRASARAGGAAVALPIADRAARIVPVPSRLLNKKPIMGDETYGAQMASHTPGIPAHATA
jgi:hypothetical protein